MSLAHIHFLSLKPTYMHLTCFLSCKLDALILAFVSYCCIQCSKAETVYKKKRKNFKKLCYNPPPKIPKAPLGETRHRFSYTANQDAPCLPTSNIGAILNGDLS